MPTVNLAATTVNGKFQPDNNFNSGGGEIFNYRIFIKATYYEPITLCQQGLLRASQTEEACQKWG